jgi:hypothetical protein
MVRNSRRGLVLSASDVFHHPSDWFEIPREEAVFTARRDDVVVVFRCGPSDCADWLDPTHPFHRGVGPHSLRYVRYFRHRDLPDRAPVSFPAGGSVETPAAPAARRPARTSPPRVKEKTWVEIELLDDDGVPVASERYTIRVPDGSTREGRLDAGGRARVDNIDPGMCEVSFPDIEAREWRPV